MKILLSLIIITACLSANSTVLTVSNHPLGGSQFTGLAAAYSAAVNGDTILLHGTGIEYALGCNDTWSKQLVVIGAGINPQKQIPQKTLIGGFPCLGFVRLGTGGNGSKFYGIEFTPTVLFNGNASNYSFENCKFNGHFGFDNNSVSNITFTNCIWDSDNNNNLQLANNNSTSVVVSNILIRNCIFDGYIEGSGNQFISVLIDHCLFLGTNTFNNLSNAIITNSVFMNTLPFGVSNCTFSNNICRVTGTMPPAGNGGSNNLSATNPNFVTYSLGSFYSPSFNFHLQPGSPATGAASDGTEIGLHGGTTRFNESMEVLIAPVMRSVNINNPTVSPNGTLNVNINASKPSDN